jgi:hypothetical protein
MLTQGTTDGPPAVIGRGRAGLLDPTVHAGEGTLGFDGGEEVLSDHRVHAAGIFRADRIRA